MKLTIIIPTYGRSELLERTLRSIAEGCLPVELREIVVVENGPKGTSEAIVARQRNSLPLRYEYSAPANKSAALNHVLAACGDDLLVFFDDDIRVATRTLTCYAEAMSRGSGHYFGGRCKIDYEEAPSEWLRPFLPLSVTGFSLGSHECPVDEAVLLGFNWAAFAADLRKLGGFNEDRGPGTISRGQETDMQERLLDVGIKGHYLPGAVVWHYVPRERCSPAWALDRADQMAVFQGMNLSRCPRLVRTWRIFRCHARALKAKGRLRLLGERGSEMERFECLFKLRACGGYLKGARKHWMQRTAMVHDVP